MRRAQQQQQGSAPGVVRVDQLASHASSFRELDDAFLQTQTKIWLGEVLHLRFDEDILIADLLGDGELLFQVSKLCQILGLAGIDLFTPSDVVEKRNVRKVCMCIRSLSKKAGMMRLNVPDFDIVTHTITMPNYIVGGIRRSLEQPQCSSSCSSGHSPCDDSKRMSGQNDQQGDAHYDSDEAESSLFVLEPEDSIEDDNLSELLQSGNPPKEEKEGYGDSGHDMPEEKSLAESVGSLEFSIMKSDSADPTSFHDKQMSCAAQSPTDHCSRTRTTKCSLSSEESDSISSYLAFDSGKNDLDAPTVKVSERIHDGHVEPSNYSIQGNGKIFADHLKREGGDVQKDASTIDQHCDVLVCDRESVCSSCEEPRFRLNGESSESRLSSESYSDLTSRNTTGGQLPAVSEDDSASLILKHEINTKDHMDASKSEDKLVEPQDTAENNSNAQRKENNAPKSGKGVLKSIAGGITLVGAVFFIAHLRRSKGGSFTAVLPSFSERSVQSDPRAKNVDKGKSLDVYPGGWLKV